MGYRLANTTMEDLGVDVLGAMDGTSTTVQTIMLNDKVMLRVCYYYVNEDSAIDWLDFLDELDVTVGGLQQFKDGFWDMVLGFLPPQATPALKAMRRHVEKQLKDPDIKTLSDSSLESSVDSE